MARIVKDPDIRRNEILAAAQGLFYSKGYEQTAVQDIIEHVGIAKGTFYHYFRSKEDLLDAMVNTLIQTIIATVEPMTNDEDMTAPEKFQQLFADTAALKLENRALIDTLLPVWYSDQNAIMREKMKAASLDLVAPLFTRIIRQGVAEGSFDTPYPDEIGMVVMQVGQNLSEAIVKIMVEGEDDKAIYEKVMRVTAVYEDAMIRLLGAPSGSLKLFDIESFRSWFT